MPDFIVTEILRSDIYNPGKAALLLYYFQFKLLILSNIVAHCRNISAFLNVSALNRVDTNGNIIYNIYDRLNRMIRTSNYLFRLYIRQRRKSVSSSVRHESRYKSFPLLRGVSGFVQWTYLPAKQVL